jgi:FAD/FMN-containing dehydrogenase
VIATASLNRIHSVGPEGADVDAGVLWSELVAVAFEAGLTPPVLTGFLGLSIGGTLSVGGVSDRTDQGLQIDRVRELEVVTGAGELVRCSMTCEHELFEAMLGGLGQCGVITRAKLELVPAPALVREYTLRYRDNAACFHDLRALLDRGDLDGVTVSWVAEGRGLIGQINAFAFAERPALLDDAHVLSGLVAPAAVNDFGYLEWAMRVDAVIAERRATLDWDQLLKPWFDVWLSESAVEEYCVEVLRTLTLADVGEGGFLLLLPQRRSTLTRPLLRLPEPDGHDRVHLFDLLTTCPDRRLAEQMLVRNRRLFDAAREVGGRRYPIGSLDFDRADWIDHYGSWWAELEHRKRRYDPDGILTPGPGIFA